MPSKSSHTNGNGRCKVHPHTATACRACLVQGLQEFRLTNLRAGLRIAAKQISVLRAEYAAKGSAEVKAAMIAYELGTLLARLQAGEDKLEGLPVDSSVMISAMAKTNGRRATTQAS